MPKKGISFKKGVLAFVVALLGSLTPEVLDALQTFFVITKLEGTLAVCLFIGLLRGYLNYRKHAKTSQETSLNLD